MSNMAIIVNKPLENEIPLKINWSSFQKINKNLRNFLHHVHVVWLIIPKTRSCSCMHTCKHTPSWPLCKQLTQTESSDSTLPAFTVSQRQTPGEIGTCSRIVCLQSHLSFSTLQVSFSKKATIEWIVLRKTLLSWDLHFFYPFVGNLHDF